MTRLLDRLTAYKDARQQTPTKSCEDRDALVHHWSTSSSEFGTTCARTRPGHVHSGGSRPTCLHRPRICQWWHTSKRQCLPALPCSTSSEVSMITTSSTVVGSVSGTILSGLWQRHFSRYPVVPTQAAPVSD